MKWSEQMRVLLSEDEHYNQLLYDLDGGRLYINGEMIAKADSITSEGRELTITYDKFTEIIKKYPFFTDIKFLLNCIFMWNSGTYISYQKPISVSKYNNYYELYNSELSATLNIYFK